MTGAPTTSPRLKTPTCSIAGASAVRLAAMIRTRAVNLACRRAGNWTKPPWLPRLIRPEPRHLSPEWWDEEARRTRQREWHTFRPRTTRSLPSAGFGFRPKQETFLSLLLLTCHSVTELRQPLALQLAIQRRGIPRLVPVDWSRWICSIARLLCKHPQIRSWSRELRKHQSAVFALQEWGNPKKKCILFPLNHASNQ